ncbi:MAG: hypothetical protein OXC69_01700 [Candidatus Tectomicrobia bacterium]|nr:hypothetical protein [Candidatus Tectomicrobia bacterium]
MAEADRLGVIKKVVEKRLRQRQAAKQLGVGNGVRDTHLFFL